MKLTVATKAHGESRNVWDECIRVRMEKWGLSVTFSLKLRRIFRIAGTFEDLVQFCFPG